MTSELTSNNVVCFTVVSLFMSLFDLHFVISCYDLMMIFTFSFVLALVLRSVYERPSSPLVLSVLQTSSSDFQQHSPKALETLYIATVTSYPI